MDIEQYLQRIGLNEAGECNLDTLHQLVQQHMFQVPFENLDVIHHVPIPLDVERYYQKVVLNYRGGFCYELNGLFNWLLQNIGFDSRLISATVNGPSGAWSLEGSHACLIVELDQPYLVDVGFGDSARMPLPLTGETRKDISGMYRVIKLEENIYDLQRKETEDEWNTLYRLDSRERDLTEFQVPCHFNQTSPESPFTQKEIASLATSDGRITLSEDSLIITSHGEKQKMHVSDSEKPTILQKYFKIDLNN